MQNNNANKSKLLKTEVNVDRIVYAQRIGCLDSFREQRVLKAGSRLTSPLWYLQQLCSFATRDDAGN